MTPERLGALAGLSQWDRRIWLAGAALTGKVLAVPTAEQAGVLSRCYLGRLQAVIAGLTVTVEARKPPSILKPQPAVRKPYKGRLADEARQEDLLD